MATECIIQAGQRKTSLALCPSGATFTSPKLRLPLRLWPALNKNIPSPVYLIPGYSAHHFHPARYHSLSLLLSLILSLFLSSSFSHKTSVSSKTSISSLTLTFSLSEPLLHPLLHLSCSFYVFKRFHARKFRNKEDYLLNVLTSPLPFANTNSNINKYYKLIIFPFVH